MPGIDPTQLRMRYLLLLAATGCGLDAVPAAARGDGGLQSDAPPPGLSVRVESPNGGESFYQTDVVMVSWVPHHDVAGAITCDVEARGATTIPITAASSAASDQPSSAVWMPAAVAPGPYKIVVVCRDELGQTATDESNAELAISDPPRDVSFAGELQSILTASCTSANCHDSTQPQLGLQLTTGVARGDLFDVSSQQCGSLKLVVPNAPNESYLIDKLVGNNPGGCFVGLRMPKLASALSAAEIQAFRDWIANGAPDN